jgi:FkbM family methyltransferase
MDKKVEEQRLFEAVSAAYAKYAANEIAPLDIIDGNKADKSDPNWIRHAIETKADYQPDASVFTHFSNDQGVIVELGAHWGYTALAIRNSGTDCPVISIEASPANTECLAVLRDYDPRYDYLIQAVGENEATHELVTPVVNGFSITGLSNIDGNIFGDWHARIVAGLVDTYLPMASSYKVQFAKTVLSTKRLDTILEQHRFRFPVTKVAAIKIDVESHEIPVLRGAMSVIERDRPFMMIEGGNANQTMLNMLTDWGYLYATRDGDAVRLTTGPSSVDNGYWVHASRQDEYSKRGLLVA